MSFSSKRLINIVLILISAASFAVITYIYPLLRGEALYLYILPITLLIFAFDLRGIIIGIVVAFICWYYLFTAFRADDFPIEQFIFLVVASTLIYYFYTMNKQRADDTKLLYGLLSNIHIGVLISNIDTKVYAFNNIARKFLDLGDASGEKIILEKLQEKGISNKINEAIELKKELPFLTKINNTTLEIYIAPQTKNSSLKITAITTIVDRTERERLKELKGDLIDFAAHQVNTPLTAINNYADILAKNNDGDQAIKEKIYKNTGQIAFLIQNIPEVYTLSEEVHIQDTLKFEKSSLKSILKNVLDPLSSLLDRRKLTLNILSDGDHILNADTQHIGFILTCLVHNAVKFNIENGVIEISYEKADDFLKITIANTFKIDKSLDLAAIFEKGIYGADGHSGIGLAYAKTITKAHGGEIFASITEDENKFAVSLTLPLAENPVSYSVSNLSNRNTTDTEVFQGGLIAAEKPKNNYKTKKMRIHE